MKNKITRAAALLLVIAVVMCWYLGGCSGTSPVGPTEPKDYVVYFCDLNSDDQYFGYHPLTGQLDSFSIPIMPQCGMTVSADGKKLYLALRDSSFVVDLDDPGNISQLPYSARGGIAVSPDNQMVAILGADGINILSTSDYSTVVFHDTDHVYTGTFSADSKTFYCSGSPDGTAYVYNAVLSGSSPVVRTQFSGRQICQILPSVDESKWFLYNHYWNCVYIFEIYDTGPDSTVFSKFFQPGYGELESTPDGRYIFYTYPDSRITYCFPSDSSFTVYDVVEGKLNEVIITVDSVYGADPGPCHPGSIEITPDGQRLIGIDPHRGILMVVDIRTVQLERYIGLGRLTHLYGLTCENAP